MVDSVILKITFDLKKKNFLKRLKHFVQFTVLHLKEAFTFNSTRYSIMYHTILGN